MTVAWLLILFYTCLNFILSDAQTPGNSNPSYYEHSLPLPNAETDYTFTHSALLDEDGVVQLNWAPDLVNGVSNLENEQF